MIKYNLVYGFESNDYHPCNRKYITKKVTEEEMLDLFKKYRYNDFIIEFYDENDFCLGRRFLWDCNNYLVLDCPYCPNLCKKLNEIIKNNIE